MKFSYLAAITTSDMNWLEEIIHNAIQGAIVEPFVQGCLKLWVSFMGVAHYTCLFVALAGVIFLVFGVEKGKKAAVISSLIFFWLQMINWVVMG